MTRRIDYVKIAPDAFRALMGMQQYVNSSGLESSLLELVKLRASYMNGCGYCVDMHTKDARAAGETEQRLYAVVVWRDTPFFTDRERAALAWTEAVTDQRRGDAADAVFDDVRAQFDETELVKLTMAVVTINSWNRLNVCFHAEAGGYRPRAAAAAVA
jgi:AhpD family alkylhydroperoxidase